MTASEMNLLHHEDMTRSVTFYTLPGSGLLWRRHSETAGFVSQAAATDHHQRGGVNSADVSSPDSGL